MTYNANHDRTYWRCEDDRRLIEAARESNHELAIALGERLEALTGNSDDFDRWLTEAIDNIDDLSAKLSALRDNISE